MVVFLRFEGVEGIVLLRLDFLSHVQSTLDRLQEPLVLQIDWLRDHSY